MYEAGLSLKSDAMRVIFAGTPEFASVALVSLHHAGFEIPLVLTQPDRPAGRGLALHASSVKQWAQQHGAALSQPRSLRLDGRFADDAAAAQQAISAAHADVLVVAAYGLMLPPWLLDLPRLGCLNIHASLLPRWRGAAPIHRAIEVRALDLDGRQQTHRADGTLAVCIQHEMDHLLGKVFVEYLSPLKRNRIKTKLIKQKKDDDREAVR